MLYNHGSVNLVVIKNLIVRGNAQYSPPTLHYATMILKQDRLDYVNTNNISAVSYFPKSDSAYGLRCSCPS